MHKMRYAALISIIFYILQPHIACSLHGAGKKPSPNEDIKKILDEKLLKYDQSHRSLKSYDSNFSLNYNKNYGKASRFEGVQNPMIEQQNRIDDFKSFTRGPREDFYGFSMRFPIKP